LGRVSPLPGTQAARGESVSLLGLPPTYTLRATRVFLSPEHMFAYAGRMIRVRGVPISDDEAVELARGLAHDELAASLVDRLERAVGCGGGLVATDRLEARAALFAVQAMLARREHSDRLLELRRSLVAMLDA
jgi:hypothetical protein